MRLFFTLLICCRFFTAGATHVMGGEITWKCSGNGYVFELIFYRDCNGVEVNTISENIEVWNHPTITQIPVAFISRQDISPTCTPVAGSPTPLACGTGANGGNGVGAIEKITYRSAPVTLSGTPPAGTGWIFTYDNFSRSNIITNLTNPDNYGLTIAARMYAIPGATAGVCIDNSPVFLQDPYLVSCAGIDYTYNMHPVDIDLDSISVGFGTPLNNFSGTFNPPVDPAPVPYEPGFSATSPTPDATFNPGNVAAQLNPGSGELTFKTNTTGSFVVKVITQSFRKGVLIAEVEREMQLIVLNCTGNNNAPVITPPFAGSFETTVDAGTLVTFNLQSTDVELLQDGTPQTNTLTTSGLLYGTGFTSNTGCTNAPCATLNQTPAISGTQGVSTQFSWQTDCNHLVSPYGLVETDVPYHFVFKVQDNYCRIPKITYATVTINVHNPGIIPATSIQCLSTAANGDVTVSWNPVNDPDGTFVQYELHSVQNGLLGTYPIGTTSAVVTNPGGKKDFFVNVISGCNGNATTTSDTVSNVFLNVTNPSNGTAILQWNLPSGELLPGLPVNALIEMEYPAGVWQSIATVPYGATFYTDTISICSAFLNYRVSYPTPGCNFSSNIDGEQLEDMITPDIPVISSVSIDTLTGNVVITWNVNPQPDTYGYVIYQKGNNGFLNELDTVWGINSNSYSYHTTVNGPVTYSIAAFDSCMTNTVPATYQTSAKSPLHTSMFMGYSTNLCDNTVALTWTEYEGWIDPVQSYTVFMRDNSGPWTTLGTSATPDFTWQLTPLHQYCFVVQALSQDGATSFGNKVCFTLNGPTPPAVHYLQVATVNGSSVDLRHSVSTGSNVKAIRFEKYNVRNGQFEELVTVPATASPIAVSDHDVDVSAQSYRYRAIVIDSCDQQGQVSNLANTILLQAATNQTTLVNYLNWSAYSVFDGGVFQYLVYRGIDGNFDPAPLATVSNDHRFYTDDVSMFDGSTGRICYRIVAQEGFNNQYGFSEFSVSNDLCTVIEPLVYIPNAFTPNGANPIFKPVVSFTNVQEYELTILDRWGQRVFYTNDPNQGWNGEHDLSHERVATGTYNYVVKVVDGSSQEIFYRGFVSILY